MKKLVFLLALISGLLVTFSFRSSNAEKYGAEHITATGTIKPAATSATAQGAANLFEFEILRNEYDRANLGLAIAPVPLQARTGRTRFLVGLGSYIVNGVGACVGCHTTPTYAPGGNPFQGQPKQFNAKNYLAGGALFGPFRARNLTPDPNNGNRPAGLHLVEFIETMRTGRDFKNLHPQISPRLQVMPWPEHQSMTDRDLTAIYYYLSAIPHADPVPPAN